MIAIDQSKLIDPVTGLLIPPVNVNLMAPGATFAYNSGAKTLTVTGTTTMTGPDTFKRANIQIIDNEGIIVFGNFATATGNTGAIDVSSLNLAGPLVVKATLVSTLGIQADGEANYINASNASGALGYWQIDFTTNP